jgi:adenylosuccinate synthase
VAAQIHKRWNCIGVRIGGPNAGHTVVDNTGTHWAFRHLPVAAIADPQAPLVLAAGSEIDPAVLAHEVEQVEAVGIEVQSRLFIDRHATWLEQRHIDEETASSLDTTGSTKKGIGAARADRIWRKARRIIECDDLPGQVSADATDLIRSSAAIHGRDILIEGTQGYGLGVHTDWYPHTTSGDCRAIDCLAQAGLLPGPDGEVEVWLVFRTYPIRIAGTSGDMAEETSWDDLNRSSGGYVKPELTTVTKKTRRVGLWDTELALAAVEANGGHGQHMHPCLMFTDYWQPDLAGVTRMEQFTSKVTDETIDSISRVESEIGAIHMFGTGPDTVVWNLQNNNRGGLQ